MDSLTQIVLGAACGEAILGKKIGNKALLLGAIGGTIPDLDVFIGKLFYTDELAQFLFHRGIMHSLFFCLTFAIVLAYFSRRFIHIKRGVSLKRWYVFWALALGTHPILDAFTAYGTQLWLPFSDFRVGWNTISVVDLYYTVPFLICLVALMFFHRVSSKRRWLLFFGLSLSSFYLVWTCYNRYEVKQILNETILAKNIKVQSTFLQPTLFTNYLWYAAVETQEGYYCGYYSLNDIKPVFKLNAFVTKDFNAREKYSETVTLKELEKFTKGFYNMHQKDGDTIRFSDLRYPLINEQQPNKGSVFGYNLVPNAAGELDLIPFRPEFEPDEFNKLFERIKGL